MLSVTLWCDVKHKEKRSTPNVFGDRGKCKDYPTRIEGEGMDASDVIRRMRQVLAVKSDSALAAALALASSAPSNWRQRNRPPLGACVSMARTQGVSLDWLVLGIGEMRGGKVGRIRDASDTTYRVSSDAARRIARFLAAWDAARTPEEMIWLEQHLRRTVPEYDQWFDGLTEEEP